MMPRHTSPSVTPSSPSPPETQRQSARQRRAWSDDVLSAYSAARTVRSSGESRRLRTRPVGRARFGRRLPAAPGTAGPAAPSRISTGTTPRRRLRPRHCRGPGSEHPGGKFGLAAFAAVRDDQAGAGVAAVGNRAGLADGGLGAGLLPRLAVVAVPGERPTDHDDQAGIGVDDDLVVGGVPVVLRPLGDGVVGWGPGCRPRSARCPSRTACGAGERASAPDVVGDPVRRRLGHPEQRGELAHREVRAPAGRDQQCPVLQRKAPRPALADHVRALAPQHRHQLPELPRAQPREGGYPWVQPVPTGPGL